MNDFRHLAQPSRRDTSCVNAANSNVARLAVIPLGYDNPEQECCVPARGDRSHSFETPYAPRPNSSRERTGAASPPQKTFCDAFRTFGDVPLRFMCDFF